jgi:hypothetical protein
MSRPLFKILLAQVVAPLALLAWVVLVPATDWMLWCAKIGFSAAYLGVVSLIGLWVPPWSRSLAWGLLGVAAAVAALWRRPSLPWPGTLAQWADVAVLLLAALVPLTLYLSAYRRRGTPPVRPIPLRFPLADGDYLVANGGFNRFVNRHVTVLAHQALRGQAYGVDLLRLNRFGMQARGCCPRDPGRYRIFGTAVCAPCDGTVIEAVDDLPDLSPPERDREHPLGNHVWLACGDVQVLLAHLQRGSVGVSEGAQVRTGAYLGRVGNSGHSSAPHLHIHVQRGDPLASGLDAEPVPIAFEEGLVLRNQRLRRPRTGRRPMP